MRSILSRGRESIVIDDGEEEMVLTGSRRRRRSRMVDDLPLWYVSNVSETLDGIM